MRLCSGLVPLGLRQAISTDDPDQQAGLKMVRSMGRAARLLNAQLRHCVSSIQGEQLSDVASSSMNGSDSSDENLPTDPSSDSDDSTSDHSASSYESVDLSDDTAGYTDHTGGPPHPTFFISL